MFETIKLSWQRFKATLLGNVFNSSSSGAMRSHAPSCKGRLSSAAAFCSPELEYFCFFFPDLACFLCC